MLLTACAVCTRARGLKVVFETVVWVVGSCGARRAEEARARARLPSITNSALTVDKGSVQPCGKFKGFAAA